MHKSVITNLIESIRSPHLRRVGVYLKTMLKEVEHFPWGAVNNLTRVSPYMLKRVEVGLQLLVESRFTWGLPTPLAPPKYERYIHQVYSALPNIDKKVITRILVRHSPHLFANLTSRCSTFSMQDIYDAVVCVINQIE